MTRETVFQGRKFQVNVQDETMPGGAVVRREWVVHPGAVGILPLVDGSHVCLVRNRRFSINEELWEIPAGTLEPGENPEVAAVRELREETGYQAGRCFKFGEFFPSPGVLGERIHLFQAQDLTPGEQDLEDDEQIVTHVVPWDQAMQWVQDGTIRDGKTLVALLLWERLFAGNWSRR